MDDRSHNEQPLFQNTDEHEQVYAPQQLPRTAETIASDGTTGDPINPVVPSVPPAAPTSTTAPELTLTAPVDLAARNIPAGDDDSPRDEIER